MRLQHFVIVFLSIVQISQAAPKSAMKITIDAATKTISIKNQSSGGDAYYILYGDGSYDKSTSPIDFEHTYQAPGTYEVCMITQAISSTANSITADTLCQTVVIEDVSCTAMMQVTVNAMTLQAENLSIGDYNKVSWYLEGIKQWINKNEITYQFPRPGLYTLRIIVEGKYCESEKDTTLLIRPDTLTPVANFSFSPTSAYTISFQNLSLGRWTSLQWDFGDGNFSSENNPVHQYTHPGNFKVQLNLIDSIRQLSSQFSTRIKIAHENIQYLPDFEAVTQPDTNIVLFTNTSVAASPCSYIWTFGDGHFSTDSAPSYRYPAAGQYNVCLTQFANSKRYTTCKTINVGNDLSPLTFNYLIVNPHKVTFTGLWNQPPDAIEWDFGDDNFSNEAMPTHHFRYDSIYLVTLKVRWGNITNETYQIVNLTNNSSKLIARFKSQFSQLKATTKRVRYRGALSGDVSRVRFEWNFGDGTSDTLNLNPMHNYNHDSIYTVCLKVYNDLTNDSDVFCQQIQVGNVGLQHPSNTLPLSIIQQNGRIQAICNFQSTDWIRIELFDLTGRIMKNIYSGLVNPGSQSFEFTVPAGTYVLRLLGKSHIAIKKIIAF